MARYNKHSDRNTFDRSHAAVAAASMLQSISGVPTSSGSSEQCCDIRISYCSRLIHTHVMRLHIDIRPDHEDASHLAELLKVALPSIPCRIVGATNLRLVSSQLERHPIDQPMHACSMNFAHLSRCHFDAKWCPRSYIRPRLSAENHLTEYFTIIASIEVMTSQPYVEHVTSTASNPRRIPPEQSLFKDTGVQKVSPRGR